MAQPIPQLDFVTAVKVAIARIKDMEGRSRRSEFWWTMLALFIVNIILAFIPFGWILSLILWVCTIPLQCRRLHDIGKGNTMIYIYSGVYVLTLILSKYQSYLAEKAWKSLDFSAASTHDSLVIPMIIVGLAALVLGIILLIWFVKDSQPGTNQYGPSPKYPDFQ